MYLRKILITSLFILNLTLNSCEEKAAYYIKNKGIFIHLIQYDYKKAINGNGGILDLKVDAIVNPANPSLRHLGGLCGIIHKKAGPQLERECLKLPVIEGKDIRCKPGQAVITKGYHLNAKYVIHAVGPIYNEDKEPAKKLADAYKNSLILMKKKRLFSIAFPSISSGVYGYPIEESSKIAVDSIIENSDLIAIEENCSIVKNIYLVVLGKKHFDIYQQHLDQNEKCSKYKYVKLESDPIFGN